MHPGVMSGKIEFQVQKAIINIQGLKEYCSYFGKNLQENKLQTMKMTLMDVRINYFLNFIY